jgi:hypothetical protein
VVAFVHDAESRPTMGLMFFLLIFLPLLVLAAILGLAFATFFSGGE